MGEGYGSEHFAPGHQEKTFSGYLDYLVTHNVLVTLSHVAKLYKTEFQEEQKGKYIQIKHKTNVPLQY